MHTPLRYGDFRSKAPIKQSRQYHSLDVPNLTRGLDETARITHHGLQHITSRRVDNPARRSFCFRRWLFIFRSQRSAPYSHCFGRLISRPASTEYTAELVCMVAKVGPFILKVILVRLILLRKVISIILHSLFLLFTFGADIILDSVYETPATSSLIILLARSDELAR